MKPEWIEEVPPEQAALWAILGHNIVIAVSAEVVAIMGEGTPHEGKQPNSDFCFRLSCGEYLMAMRRVEFDVLARRARAEESPSQTLLRILMEARADA